MDRLNKPYTPLLITAIIWYVFLASVAARLDYNLTRFLVAGDMFTNRPGIYTEHNSGYDGQFYYRLALTPFTDKIEDEGIRVDTLPYRQQRILYSLLARLVSLNYIPLLPFALLLVNFIAVCLIAWAGGQIAAGYGRSYLWGVLFALYPGFVFTLTHDLTEAVEIAFLLLGILAYGRSRFWLSGILFALAILGKETALLVPLALGATLLWKRPAGERWVAVGLPVLVTIMWQLWIRANWGLWGRLTAPRHVALPFNGLYPFWQRIWWDAGLYETVWKIELVLLLLVVAAVLVAWRTSTAEPYLWLAWVLYLGLFISLTQNVFVEDIAFMRAGVDMVILGLILILSGRRRLAWPVGVGFIMVFVSVVLFRVAVRWY